MYNIIGVFGASLKFRWSHQNIAKEMHVCTYVYILTQYTYILVYFLSKGKRYREVI